MKAIKWTKKIMYEEGHALPQLIHMWHMIVRHPALFYSCRSHFVGQMVNSLNRLGLPPKYVAKSYLCRLGHFALRSMYFACSFL